VNLPFQLLRLFFHNFKQFHPFHFIELTQFVAARFLDRSVQLRDELRKGELVPGLEFREA